jgi:hypothetical protein
MKEIKIGTRKLQQVKGSFVLNMPVAAVRTLDLHYGDTMFVLLTDDGAIRIYERVGRGNFYREGISSFTVEELDDMLDEAYKEVVKHHVGDLSQDVLEDEKHPTTGLRWYYRIKDYVEYVNSYWGLLVFILDRLCGK